MLVVDELKKNDPQLRLVAMVLVAGLVILLAGLWWVQVVSTHEFQAHLENQEYRTIRIPAVRVKILDREGRVLAENRPSYNLSLYLDDLRRQFATAYGTEYGLATNTRAHLIAAQEKKLGRSLTKAERKQYNFKPEQLEQLRAWSRIRVAQDVVARLSHEMDEPIPFDAAKFNAHYLQQLAMPYPLMPNLSPDQIARFQENYTNGIGADLDLQSIRYYPNGTLAAHVLGELRKDSSSIAGEESSFNYRLPDYRGVTGIEAKFNGELHGRAGEESVLVNNYGYRQSEDVDSEPLPGDNVVLTIDLDIQQAAEHALQSPKASDVDATAAVIVMDVHSGDIIAMASAPTFDPNDFAQGISTEKYKELQDVTAEKNRATHENYAPGSVFKTVIALAALEHGLNPNETYHVEADPARPEKGCIYIGRRKIQDTAPPGDYNFEKAFIHSSNSYFITNGIRAGVNNICRIAHEFHLGETNGLLPGQDAAGDFPNYARVNSSTWRAGDTANLSIGQGEIAVTPLQIAIMVATIANGGTVLWPRLVDRIETQDLTGADIVTNFPSGVVRDHLVVHPRSMQLLRAAMLQDVASDEGSGKAARIDGYHICGKTGTAQVQDSANKLTGHNYWFASFAPYENPKYAVVAMVQSPTEHGSGGEICGPIAKEIYEAILKKQSGEASKTVARTN